MAVLACHVHNAFGAVLACAKSRGLRGRGAATQGQGVQTCGAAKDHPTPLPLNIEANAAIKRVAEERELDWARLRALSSEVGATCHNQRTGKHIVIDGQDGPHVVVGRNSVFLPTRARRAENGRAGLDDQGVARIDEDLLSQDIEVVARPGGCADSGPVVVGHPNGVAQGHRRTSACRAVGEQAGLGPRA